MMDKTNWKTFVGRRKIVVGEWLHRYGVKNYKQLCEKCKAMGIEPPPKGEVSFKRKTKAIDLPAEPAVAETPKKTRKKHTRRKKKAATVEKNTLTGSEALTQAVEGLDTEKD
jgi:hypothetical protein